MEKAVGHYSRENPSCIMVGFGISYTCIERFAAQDVYNFVTPSVLISLVLRQCDNFLGKKKGCGTIRTLDPDNFVWQTN